jgi:hypothetical protein
VEEEPLCHKRVVRPRVGIYQVRFVDHLRRKFNSTATRTSVVRNTSIGIFSQPHKFSSDHKYEKLSKSPSQYSNIQLTDRVQMTTTQKSKELELETKEPAVARPVESVDVRSPTCAVMPGDPNNAEVAAVQIASGSKSAASVGKNNMAEKKNRGKADDDIDEEVLWVSSSPPPAKKKKNTKEEEVKEAEVDNDSDDSLEPYRHRSSYGLMKVHRHVPPPIKHRSSPQTLSAVFSLASAMWFQGDHMMGGQLAASLQKLLMTAEPGKTLLHEATNIVEAALAPMYKIVVVRDPKFNVWKYSTTFPVYVLTPHRKHGINKVQGFAVSHGWIFDCTKESCVELTPDNLIALGYFDKMKCEDFALEMSEKQDGKIAELGMPEKQDGKLDGSESAVTRGCEGSSHASESKVSVEHEDRKYRIANGVEHYAVMMSNKIMSDWFNATVACKGTNPYSPRRSIN